MLALRTLVVLASGAAVLSSQTPDCSYVSLLNHLNLKSSNDFLTVMRPVKNWTVATDVVVNMFLYGMLQLDEKSQTITSHIWVQMMWQNDLLTWNPKDFISSLEVINVSLSPQVTIFRKPMLYVINLIVPLFFLLVLDLASFFICDNSGEKLSFKVTVLLSISVLLLILKDILPSTEDELPMIGEKKTRLHFT
ncbi:unnamed protein product, partial [Lampetra planeri]